MAHATCSFASCACAQVRRIFLMNVQGKIEKRKGFMVGHVRKDELLAESFVIEERKVSILIRNQLVVKSQLAGDAPRGMCAVGRRRLRRVVERTRCWRNPNWPKI